MRSLVLPAMVAVFSACTGSGPGGAEAPRPGSLVGGFAPAEVSEITLAKNDPRQGDAWTARLRRGADGEWQVMAGPGGKELLDRRADGGFIEHLADTLRTLQVEKAAPAGPDASFGLAPPVFRLRWSNAAGETRDLSIGEPVSTKNETAGTYARLGDSGGVFVAQGAALGMLAHLTSFDVLRRRVLLTLTSDDVDEFELYEAGKARLYAQRQGDDWADRKERKFPAKLQEPVREILDGLTHLRIAEFVDDAARADQARAFAAQAPSHRAVFRDRQGVSTELLFRKDRDGRWLGTVSTRPQAAFELYPETVGLLARFSGLGAR